MLADSLETVGSIAASLADRLGSASLTILAAAILLHVLKLFARGRAWHNIVTAAYPDEELRYRHSLGAYLSGVGVNAIVPARPGEVLKLALLRRRAPGARYEGLASCFVTESVFDTLTGTLALTAGLLLGWASFGGSLLSPFAPVAGHPWLVLTALGLAVPACLLVWRCLGGRLRGAVAEARRGFSIFGHPLLYLRRVVAWQALGLLLRLVSIACFLAAFHVPVTLGTTVVVLAVQCASNVIPLTPGGAGTQQALLVVALGAGMTTSSIVGFGTGTQLATTIADVLLATISLGLMTRSLHWRRLLPAPAALVEADATAVN